MPWDVATRIVVVIGDRGRLLVSTNIECFWLFLVLYLYCLTDASLVTFATQKTPFPMSTFVCWWRNDGRPRLLTMERPGQAQTNTRTAPVRRVRALVNGVSIATGNDCTHDGIFVFLFASFQESS